jgi:hypothetical protein
MYTQDELDAHLQALTDAWNRYAESYHSPVPQLGHLHAVWAANRELDWLYAHNLHLWRDIVWEHSAFVLTESIIQEQAE